MNGDLAEHRRTAVYRLDEVIADVDTRLREHRAVDARSVPTGFDVLDDMLGGGLHTGELVLLGGPPGVGKTIAALQWARNVARAGGTALFVCYEHEPFTLLTRLLALEAGASGGDHTLARTMAEAMAHGEQQNLSLEELVATTPAGIEALEAIRSYADRLVLVRASGAHTTLAELDRLLTENQSQQASTVMFVDYLQKIPVEPEPPTEAEKVTRTVEALKDLALDHSVPIVLLSAVDAEGMRSSRLRMYHLRGSSAIAFESDVVLMLNDKEKAVSKIHLTYDPVRARGFKDWVVFSVEKNRGGPNLVELEFRKDFVHFRFEPEGGIVTEKLVTERMDEATL